MNAREQDYPRIADLLKVLRAHTLHYSDQDGAANVIDSLLKELHELKRTRSEQEARASVQGYRLGRLEMQRQIQSISKTKIWWLDWEPPDTDYGVTQ